MKQQQQTIFLSIKFLGKKVSKKKTLAQQKLVNRFEMILCVDLPPKFLEPNNLILSSH